MTVATFTQPNYTGQTAAQYKANIDGAFSVLARLGQAYAPHERVSGGANMSIDLDAGYLWNGSTLTTVAAQNVSGFTAPVGNPRIDRVVIDAVTGAGERVTGTPAASPAAPAIPGGKIPICQILLQTSTTAIGNSMITDERVVASSSIPVVTEITGNLSLTASDIGKSFYISAAADVTLPALSTVPVGAFFELVSATYASQRIYPNGSELLDGVNSFYRLPSWDAVTIRKITATAWRIVSRPPYGVGAVIEMSTDQNTVAQLLGPGWAQCDGSQVSRTTYGNLAGAYLISAGNYRWGNGDGSTTFNLPDDRGRVTLGVGTGSGLTARTISQTGGAESVALSVAELAAHAHTVNDPTHAHTDTYSYVAGAGGAGPLNSGGDYLVTTTNTVTSYSYTGISLNNNGSGSAHNNVQPFNVKLKYVKL